MSKITKYMFCKESTEGFTADKSYRIAHTEIDGYGLAVYHLINDSGEAVRFGQDLFEFFRTAVK